MVAAERAELYTGWMVLAVLAASAVVVVYDRAHPHAPVATELQANCPAYKARIRQLNQREGLVDLTISEDRERAADSQYVRRWCISP